MSNNKRKLKSLCIDEKVAVIRAVERGDEKKIKIAKQFGIPVSTLSTFLREKDKILKLYSERLCGHKKRVRQCKYPAIEESVSKWVMQQISQNISFDEKLLQSKAEEIAKEHGLLEFRASSGWVCKFKKRHGLLKSRKSIFGSQLSVKNCNNLTRQSKTNQDYSSDENKYTHDTTMTFQKKPCQREEKSEKDVDLIDSNVKDSEELPLSYVNSQPINYEVNIKLEKDENEILNETDGEPVQSQKWSPDLPAVGDRKEIFFQDSQESDSAVSVCEDLTDSDNIVEVKNEFTDEEELNSNIVNQPVPSRIEVRQAIDILRRFLESTPDFDEDVFRAFRAIDKIEEIVESEASVS